MKLRSRLATSALVASAFASCATLLLAGCSNNAGNEGGDSNTANSGVSTAPVKGADGKETATGGKPLKLAFITNNASDFWTIAEKGCIKADEELEKVTVEFKKPANGTAAEQKGIIDDLLVTGIDGMAISPTDPKNQVEMINSAAKKTLLFTQDSDAPASKRACYVGTDNRAAGRQAGEEIKKALPNGGKIMVFVGLLDAQNAQDRFNGIKDAIKGSKVVLLGARTDETDRAKAKSNVSTALVATPDIACLVGLWSYNGPAILNAVKEAKKTGKVKIVCFDEEDETLAGVASGDITATVVQQPYEFGYKSITIMNAVLNGDKSKIPASKQIFVPTRVINKSNVATFRTELNKLRGR